MTGYLMEVLMGLEEELSHAKWMEVLLNSLPCAVIVVEMGSGKIMCANTAAMRYICPEAAGDDIAENAAAVMQYEEKWRTGMKYPNGELVPRENFPGIRAARGETFIDYEIHWTSFLTGETHIFLCSGGTLPPANGRPSKGIVSFVEVTEREKQREELRRAITIREEFLSVAAHELRTPISSILLQTQSLIEKLRNDKAPSEEVVDRLGSVERAANKLNKLIQELLEISRMTNPTATKLKRLDLCEVVREVIARHEPLAKRQGVAIQVVLPKERLQGSWDADKLDQILTNLLSNALKYGCAKPVVVNVSRNNGEAILLVRDYGIGVKTEDRARIFRRFERAVSSEQYAGMGIGLWLCVEAVQSMGGNIEVLSPVDGQPGSVFRVTLPIK